MSFASRRLATLAVGTAFAVIAGLAGQVGLASAADPITSQPAPTLIAPANDPAAATPLKDVVLQWSTVTHATKYEVQISPNGDWTNNTVTLPNNGKTVNTTYEVPLSLPHASYFWRVRGLHGTAHTGWSSTRSFLREWYQTFNMLTSPTSGDPSVAWEPVADASLYRVRFSTDPTFPTDSAKTATCFTAATSFTPYLLNPPSITEKTTGKCFDESALTPATTYYWDVQALDDSAAPQLDADSLNEPDWDCGTSQPECDAFSPSGQFTFQGAAADPTTLAAQPQVVTNRKTNWHTTALPGTDCTAATCPITPTFSWDAVPGANYYEVHVFRDPFFTNTYRVYDTDRPELTPREAFFDAQSGQSYYWDVQVGTCQNSGTDATCAKATSSSGSSCVAGTGTDTASINASDDGLAVAPAGPSGPHSISAGNTAGITMNGSNFAPGACVLAQPDVGVVSNVQVLSATQVHFTYKAPSSSQSVTFVVVNPGGQGGSNGSPALDVVGGTDRVVWSFTSAVSTFKKATAAVSPIAPADGSGTSARSVTFSWSPFQGPSDTNPYDVKNYRLQVAKDADFGNVVWDVSTVDLTEYTNPASVLPDGTWFWRVQGIDESGNHLTWSSVSSFTKDSTPPKVHLTNDDGIAVDATFRFTSSEALTGVSTGTVHLVAASGGSPIGGTVKKVGTRTWTLNPATKLSTGETYQLSLGGAVQDAAGNAAVVTGPGVRTSTKADDKGPAWTFSGAWTSHTSSQALGGTFSTSTSGHSATLKLVGRSIKLYACLGPAFGKLSILVDGAHKMTINEHQSFTKCGVLVWKGTATIAAPHTLKLVASTGTADFDQVRVG